MKKTNYGAKCLPACDKTHHLRAFPDQMTKVWRQNIWGQGLKFKKVLFFMPLTLLAPLFSLSDTTVSKIITFDQYASGALVLLLAGYFYVAMGESKKYGACSGCQTGNIVVTTIQYALISILLSAATYFVLRWSRNPSIDLTNPDIAGFKKSIDSIKIVPCPLCLCFCMLTILFDTSFCYNVY